MLPLLRRAHPQDYQRVGQITTTAYVSDELIPPGAAYLQFLADVAGRDRDGEVWVAEGSDGTVLGGTTFVAPGSPLCEIARGAEAEMRCLAVDPAARGQGVGEALTRLVVDRAGSEGLPALVLCSSTRMLAAHRLYSRLGFQRLPDRDWSPTDTVDLIAYTLPLDHG